MKKYLLSALLFLVSYIGFSQKGISYQAVILDPSKIEIPGQDITGQPFVNGNVWVKFAILSGNTTQFEEVQQTKTDAYGLVNLLIGSVSSGPFNALVWDATQKSLQVSVSFNQGASYTKVSDQKLSYTPYSLYAETAGKLGSILGITGGGTGATTAVNARANLGLGNVDNTSDVDKPISTATQAALNLKANSTDVNTALALKASAADLDLKAPIDSPTFTGTVSGITKSMVGLGSVDNSADADKPISTATQAALDLKVNTSDATTSLATKVDKVTGKELSTNDYTTAEKNKLAAITGTNTGDQDLSAYATNTALALKANTSDVTTSLATKANASDVTTSLATKVDKVTGKALSTNDYTTAEKSKLAAITGTNTGDQDLSAYATTALVATKANASDVTTSLATKVDKVTGKELSTNDYTTAEKNKLAAITGTNTGDQDLSALATNTALALKANTSDVNNSLATKANTSDVTASLATKVDKVTGKELSTNDYTTAEKDKLAAITGTNTGDQDLSGYATSSDVTASLATKANASDLSNYVTTNTAQTITEAKTFSKDLTVNGITVGRGGGGSDYNTAFGLNALLNNTGSGNTAVGRETLIKNENSYNSAFGYRALKENINGSFNVALGFAALIKNTDGSINVAIGNNSLSQNTVGSNNTAIGNNTLTANTIGSNNTAIGNYANVASADLTNATALGYKAKVSASNTIQLGADGTFGSVAVTDVYTSGTVHAGGFTTTGDIGGNNITANGTVTAGSLTTSGDINVNNIQASGMVTAGSFITSGDIYGGANIVASGTVKAGAVTYTNIDGAPGQVLITDGNGSASFGSIPSATNLATPRYIYGGSFDGSSDVTDIIGSTYGGTGNGFTKFSGPSNGERTFTLPDTDATILTSNTAVTVAQGGTGLTTAGNDGQVLTSSGGSLIWTTPTTISIGAIGTATTNGASIDANGVLSLTPADETYGGIVTIGTQTFAGAKTFRTDAIVNGITVGRGGNNMADNTAIGSNALGINTTGLGNTANGYHALSVNTEGNDNTAIGFEALKSNTDGNKNTASGYMALTSNLDGFSNTAIGYMALSANQFGTNNTAIGEGADVEDPSLTNATAIGSGAIVTASDMIQLGNTAVKDVKTSGNLTVNGITVGRGGGNESTNTAIGASALSVNTDGNNNTAIGYGADVASTSLNNATAIGSGASVAASNTIQLGNTAVTNVNTSGTITAAGMGLGVSAPTASAILEVSSTTQGFLPPRLTTTQRDAIATPVAGLTIWNTTNTQLEVYDGSYWKNMVGLLVSPLNIGDTYGGGKVFYIFGPSDNGYIKGQTHGLIASTSDQSPVDGIKWFPGAFYGATATNLGTGIANTALIMVVATVFNANVTSYAAGLANSCRDGGYIDWFLPSKDELNKLYQQKALIGNFVNADPFGYWSSSQKGQLNVNNYMNGISSAHFQRFDNGLQGDTGLSEKRRVRAIRIF